jgi:pimeloyl-ACP methyl ester carboxylesterase
LAQAAGRRGEARRHDPVRARLVHGAGSEYILRVTSAQRLLVYGISSGALKAALFAERHPARVARLALDAFVWTGEGNPTLDERRKKLPEFQSKNRRPIDRAFVRSIFARDHPGTADDATIEAFADANLALDDSVPTGTYVELTRRAATRARWWRTARRTRRGSPCPFSRCTASRSNQRTSPN